MTLRFDKGEMRGKTTRTDEGYLRGEAVVTRTGVFLYQNADGSTRRELRHPDDVFSKDSLDTMKMIPITDGHPENRAVDSANVKELTIGTVGETITVDGRYVLASLNITHADGIDSVDSGRKELSLGYHTQVIKEDGEYNGERYDHRQTQIKYNHLAIVDQARAGSVARLVLDSNDAFQVDNNERKKGMERLVTFTVDGIEYQASPEIKVKLERLDAENKKLKEDLEEEEKKKDKAEAERDALQEKVDKEKEDEEKEEEKKDGLIKAAVRARIDLERKATPFLKADAVEKLDSMSDREVMENVVSEFSPNAKLDGRSDEYVRARFDSIIESEPVRNDNAINKQREVSTMKQDSVTTLDSVRKDALDAMFNAHKAK